MHFNDSRQSVDNRLSRCHVIITTIYIVGFVTLIMKHKFTPKDNDTVLTNGT